MAEPTAVRWSVHVLDVVTGDVLVQRSPDLALPTASLVKVLVLTELAARGVPLDEPLDRRSVPPVGDSGLWQRLAVDVLPTGDVAALVGSVSDNWATNVLVDRLGLGAVQERGRSLGLVSSTLHDVVRDHRGPDHPAYLSTGTAAEWSGAFARMCRGEWVSPEVSRQVLDWLSAGVDHSMVLAAFGADPLVPGGLPDGPAYAHKTGSDPGVLCDAGLVRLGHGAVAYAAIAHWDDGDPTVRAQVLDELRRIGLVVRSRLERQAPDDSPGSSGSGLFDAS